MGSGALIVAVIFTPWGLVYGSLPVTITLIGWFWPKHPAREHVSELIAPEAPDLVIPEAPP